MYRKWICAVAVLLAIALASAGMLAGGLAYGATKAASSDVLKVNTGKLTGIVADSTGQPLADVALQLIRDEEVAAETQTDEDGLYAFEGLEAGSYQMLVGQERALEFEAAADGEVAELQIVIPLRDDYTAAALDQTQWVWAAAGTGVAAVAVSTPILVNEIRDDSSSRGAVSTEL
jgi:hypothetical protein